MEANKITFEIRTNIQYIFLKLIIDIILKRTML